MNQRPSLADIREAHARIAPHIHRTPVFRSRSLDTLVGAELFFKCENLQRSGSFKIRGATNAVLSLGAEEAAPGVVTHSSGNHAAALALAAHLRGIAAHIVMPENAPAVKVAAVRAYGGRITFCSPSMKAREEAAARIVAETGATLVHPYNDHRIIAGQGTAALELLEQVEHLDMVLAPVSGGGLLSGTAIAAKGLRRQVRVLGCEPRNADDAYRSLREGRIVTNEHPVTIADGLRANLGDKTFPIISELVDDIVLVREEEIVQAMHLLFERMKLVVEPSGAVGLAAALSARAKMAGKRVGIILSGGNVDMSAFFASVLPRADS
ncbi:MAG: pyridoxal-phosphate dependent enzyme [Calditrichaeota bacterium]|nr:pyridoxal-phosphate dependent enzyme [Calditrichota bacterium]